jgi:hypothetical protein
MSELDTPEPNQDAVVYSPGEPGVGSDRAHDAFDQAIAEYGEDAPKAPAGPQSLDEYFAHARSQGFTVDEARSLMPAEFRTQDELNKATNALSNNYTRSLAHLQQVAEQINSERNRQDFDRVIRTVKAELSDVLGDAFPDDTLKAMLLGAAHVDGRISEAFALRYHSPRQWENRLSGLMAKLRADLSRRPDPEATADRAAIAAAVLRGSNGPRPERAQPNLSSLSDAEYQRHVKEEHGYTPKLR